MVCLHNRFSGYIGYDIIYRREVRSCSFRQWRQFPGRLISEASDEWASRFFVYMCLGFFFITSMRSPIVLILNRTMKKLWFMLAMMICIFASCSDGGSEEPVNPTPKPEDVKTEITIDSGIISNGLSFGVTEGEQSVSFSVNADWTLSVASTASGTTWCKASATSGSKGSATVKFSVDENTGYDDRSVSVTIKAGSVSKTFTITQKGADALLVTTTKYEVAQEGGQIEIEVKANISYQMEISEDAKGWITEAESKGRTLSTTQHKLNVAMNENVEKREGEIKFKSGDKVETVKVYQGGGAILLLSQNEYTVSDAGETISVDIKSNIDFGVQMLDVDWISDEASSRGMSSHTLKYIVSANETYDSRSAEIVFYDKNSDLKDTLKVIQAQKDAIVISQKEYNVKSEGETIEVKFSANVDFEVTMPEVDWIKQINSRALKEHTFYLEVAENEGEDSRNAEIIYTNKESGIEDKVIVKQEGTKPKADVTITVAEAGTLSEHIAEDRIKTLTNVKIVGDLNGDDFDIISRMASLELLDLSEANIVSGGSESMEKNVLSVLYGNYNYVTIPENVKYFYSPKSLIKIEGVISNKIKAYSPFSSSAYNSSGADYQLMTYSALKYIEISNNLKVIGHGAFTATQLTKINLENVDSIKSYAFYGCHQLSEVTFHNPNLHIIESDAFGRCYKLANISLPDGLEEIGDEAFFRCRHERIDLPSSLKKIGKSAFSVTYDNVPETTNVYLTDLDAWCNVELENIYSSPFYLYVDYYYNYNEGVNSLLYLNNKLVTSLEINGVDCIKNYVFAGCKSFESVSIGNKITTIGEESFKGCDNITQLNIGNGVTTISKGAFSFCNKLEKVTFGKGLEKIEAEAFGYTKPIDVYCYATTPPSIVSSSNFNKIDKKTAKLYVPKGTYSAYYLSDWANIFTNIIEMD